MCHCWELEVDCSSQEGIKNACWSHIGLIWHERFLDFLAHAPPLAKTMKAGS